MATFRFTKMPLRAIPPKLHWMFCEDRIIVFEDRIISRRAGVVWPPRSCDLMPLDYYLWSAVEDKCYAYKPMTIEALKDNICEAI